MASSVEGFGTIAERSRRVGRTKSAIKPARMRCDERRLGVRCRERFTISSWCLRITWSSARIRNEDHVLSKYDVGTLCNPMSPGRTLEVMVDERGFEPPASSL